MNLGRPIVTNENSLRNSCAEVREPIELSFSVVSGIGASIHVRVGVHMAQGERGGFWSCLPQLAQWFQWQNF